MQRMSANARGSLYMVIGSMGYVINDALVRRTTENGLGVYQVLCMRSIALAVVFAVAGRIRAEPTTRSHLRPALLVRVAAEMVGSALFFAGIVRMEFANAQAILQIVPFAVTLTAAIILKERVSGLQYLTLIVGFIGVLVIVRPATDGFSAWSLVVVGAALMMVIRELATRNVPAEIPATSIAMMTAVGLAALTGVLAIIDGWHSVDTESAVILAAATASLFIGYIFAIQTVRVGDLSVSAPFRYSLLLGAVIIGYVMFDEVPDRFTIIGSLLIVAGGLFAVHLERNRPAA